MGIQWKAFQQWMGHSYMDESYKQYWTKKRKSQKNNEVQYFHVISSNIEKIKLHIPNDTHMDGETLKKSKLLTQV